MEMLELIETIRAEEASVQRLFGKEGVSVRRNRRSSPQYRRKLTEAAKLIADVMTGRRPTYILQEVMTTSDFPNLFGDVLDRAILAAYQEWPQTWQNYTKRALVVDFRTVKRFSVYGADTVLPEVPERQEYPVEKISENAPYTYSVQKRGRKLQFSFETLTNDDLQALQDMPVRLGRAARRSEEKFVTGLFVDANGPHASFYTTANKNRVHTENGAPSNNPVLSIAALQAAMLVLGKQIDEQGEPILITTVELVIPPALEVSAENYLNAVQLWLMQNLAAGSAEQNLVTTNWMKARFRLSVNPYIPIVASTANGNTSWWLFANPDNGRHALELGFLRGHEEPEVFMKAPNSMPVGGGGEDVMNGDFDTDSIEYKLRHVFGGARMDPKMTVASNGSGV